MDECFKCGISSDRIRLFDAISDEGIVKGCSKCIEEEKLPLMRKPTTIQLKEEERKTPSVYDRLKKVSGYSEETKKTSEVEKQNISLKNLVDRNYVSTFKENTKPRTDLIDNFHWVIMRTRRKKHLTHKQVAEQIGEAEVAIKMAEQARLPEDDYIFIKKLENFLGINLRKNPEFERKQIEMEARAPARILDFNPASLRDLTISDLKEMKAKREKEILERGEEKEIKEFSQENKEYQEDVREDISQEDINKIIFGK